MFLTELVNIKNYQTDISNIIKMKNTLEGINFIPNDAEE